jgi:uncharacterized tellurite resistance protein B-like protein
MVIWGIRGVTFTLEERQFQCPDCVATQNGKLKHVRNFITLYFIPIIPLNVSKRYVQCGNCDQTFDEKILSYDYEKERQQQQIRMLRVMVMSALADGQVDDPERQEINNQYEKIAGSPPEKNILAQEIRMATTSGADLNSFVSAFSNELDDQEKALVVKLAFYTMSASGELQPGHQKQLMKLSTTLGISEKQYMRLIDQFANID